jgi:5-methylcytosine-specific restriction endonuclease McrBC regulatory subunit McrC
MPGTIRQVVVRASQFLGRVELKYQPFKEDSSSMALSHSTLVTLARAGAEARIQELQREIDSIYRAFPGLSRRRSRAAAGARPGRRRRRRAWSAAQRKAAADRMKKYWATRKAAKK